MMKKSVVIDTDIMIDLLRGVPEAKDLFLKIEKGDLIGYYSIISEVELFSGSSSGRPEIEMKILNLLQVMTLLPLDSDIARIAGSFRSAKMLGVPDAIIIATALKNKIRFILTRNTKHFENVNKEIHIEKPY